MKKKSIAIIIVMMILINLPNFGGVKAANVSAQAYCIMEAGSNRVLYSSNMNEKLPMASTTKVMTAVLALEKGSLNDVIEIKKEWTGIEGTSIYLKEGEKLTLEDLLHGMMLVSGNDAAVSIACYIGGSIDNFAKMMNKKAKELGMKNTHFTNPNGLPDDDHYTTAYDFTLLASYAMKNENFVKIINDEKWSMPYEGKANQRTIYNKNKLLKSYEGANGVKTGFTKKARKCFVLAAKRNNMQVVGVLLHTENHYEESKMFLDMAFNNFTLKKVIEKGDYVKTVQMKDSKNGIIKLSAGSDVYFPLKSDESADIKYKKVYNSGSDNYIADYSIKAGDETYNYSEELSVKKEDKGTFYNFKNLFKKFANLIP